MTDKETNQNSLKCQGEPTYYTVNTALSIAIGSLLYSLAYYLDNYVKIQEAFRQEDTFKYRVENWNNYFQEKFVPIASTVTKTNSPLIATQGQDALNKISNFFLTINQLELDKSKELINSLNLRFDKAEIKVCISTISTAIAATMIYSSDQYLAEKLCDFTGLLCNDCD